MRLLHATDLHYNKHWFDWIVTQQENFEIFCLSGDFLEPASSNPGIDPKSKIPQHNIFILD